MDMFDILLDILLKPPQPLMGLFFKTVQWQCNIKEVFPSLVRDGFHAITSESLLSSFALSEQALWFDWWLEKPFLVVAFILSQIPLACCKWFITSVIPSLKLSFSKSS